MKPRLAIVIERDKADPDMWYWAVTLDGDVIADGSEGSYREAHRKANINRREYLVDRIIDTLE